MIGRHSAATVSGGTEPPRSELPLIAYSAGNFGKNLLLAGVDVTLLFMLTDLIGIAPISVSRLMLAVFCGDLVFDFAAGALSTWAQRYGFGYRSVIAFGAAPCCAAFALLYSLPALGVGNILVLGATLLMFRATYAIVDVPHNSLMVRIASNSHARGRTSGYRLLFSTMASILTTLALIPAVVRAARLGHTGNLALLGLIGGILACAALWTSAWSRRRDRRNDPLAPERPGIVLAPRLDSLFIGVAMVAFATGFAAPMFGRMAIYLATYIYHQPSIASRLLLAATIGQVPGVVLWTALVRHVEKTALLAFSHALTAGALVLFAIVPPQQAFLLPIAALVGAGLGGVFMLPWGIVADVIDFSEFRHGDRRETATFAGVLVIIKASGAASIGVIGWTLGHAGYVAGAEQTPGVLLAMKFLAFGVPLAGSLAAILVLDRMSVGHERHARIIRALHARNRKNRSPPA